MYSLAALALSLAITVAVYGASIYYGFMYDDGLDVPRAIDRSFAAIFTEAGGSSYYRPVVLAIWKTIYLILGRADATVFHLLALGTHAINGWMVYHLATRLYPRPAAYISALLFLTFPFSYQAVEITNAFFHPLVTAFALGSVLLYWRWREGGAARLLFLALLASVIAAFTHEYGVVVVGLITMRECMLFVRDRSVRPSFAPLYFVGVAAVFLPLWRLVPKWEFDWAFDPASLSLNAAYFLQATVYPISARLGADGAGSSLLWAGGAMIIAIAFLHSTARLGASLAFAVAWTGAALLPTMVMLPFSYVVDGPRLLYLASVGIALLWGGALASAFAWRRWFAWPARALGMILAGLIALQAAQFVGARASLFDNGVELVSDLVATATDPARPGQTYVNFPSWIALKQTDYAIGHSGVIMIPAYIGLGRNVYLASGKQPDLISLRFDPTARPWQHYSGPHGDRASLDDLERAFRRGGGVYATRFEPAKLTLEYAGSILGQGPREPITPFVGSFGGWTRLVVGQVEVRERVVDVTLTWQALARPSRDYTVFVHVADAQGKPVAQTDAYPIGAMFPPQRWRPGDLIEDHRRVDIPGEVPAGSYLVLVGIYDRVTGDRAAASKPNASRFRDDAVEVGAITLD